MVFVIFPFTGNGQVVPEQGTNDLAALHQSLAGTWQIQMVGTRSQPMIPFDLVERVAAIRAKKDVQYFYIDPQIRIMVLPYEQIYSPDFKPVNRIAYIGKDEAEK